MGRFEEYSDEDLLRRYWQGEEHEVIDYLMDKYKGMVRSKARALYLIGGENEDLIQEGMIGLFKAIQDYREDREASFSSFAQLCVTRQMYTAVNAYNRKKHIPLNSYISIYSGIDKEGEKSVALQDVLESITDRDPEELWIDQENVTHIQQLFTETLSYFERQVLQLYLAGEDYIEISQKLNKSPKSIDNALQRIRQKIMKSRAAKE